MNLYYFVIVEDLFCRFFWTTSLLSPAAVNTLFFSSEVLFFVQEVVEGVRRTLWAFVRVENENINNFEKYRNILEIPKLRDIDSEEQFGESRKEA